MAYIVLSGRRDGSPGFRLPGGFRAVAAALAFFNALVLVLGGVQWGKEVMLIGVGVSVAIVPIAWLSRRHEAPIEPGPDALDSFRAADAT
jgi:hypothetical protein